MDKLNPEQLEATNCINGPLLVLAGAGTGKTKVLTSRICNIITKNIAPAYNILAVTFTNKAAKEMQHRINSHVDAYDLNIGTFHSVSAKILRAHIAKLGLGLDSRFSILDQDDQIKIIKNIAVERNIDIKKHTPKLLQIIISRWKDQGLFPHNIHKNDIKNTNEHFANIVYQVYQKHLQNSNVLDFGDLLMYCNQLFIQEKEVLNYYQNRFRYILIDEYQDTNAVQYLWSRMLASKYQNICCVGDDDQSIYGWRGAEVGNILRFEKDFPNAKIIKLEQNYRSSSHILNAALGVIKNNKIRHGKKLWTAKNEGELINVACCINDRGEAKFIISQIKKILSTQNVQANQIAILVRAGFQTRAFEEELISHALPYQIIGGLRFYERKEIRDVVAYIRLAINHNDNIAFERIINTPKRSLGDVTINKIKSFANEHNISCLKAIDKMNELQIFKGKTAEILNNFSSILKQSAEDYQNLEHYKATKNLLSAAGYVEWLKEDKSEDSKARIENIEELFKALSDFVRVEDFLEHTSLVMDNEVLETDFGGTIKLMTLHASKGLEFDTVFLPGWEEGLFPHQRSLNEEGESGLEEERRIAYVGITRAKRLLYITYAEYRRIFYETSASTPSRFLQDLPQDSIKFLEQGKMQKLAPDYRSLNTVHSQNNLNQPYKFTKQSSEKTKSPGKKIIHDLFGIGTIIRTNSNNLEIAFDRSGIKTINADFVKLLEESNS